MPRRRRGWMMDNQQGAGFAHSPLTTSLLEPVLLSMIDSQPNHGYSLLTELEAVGMGTIHPGVVYRTLRDMEDLGWITSRWDLDQTQGPPRRTYSLSENGKTALKNWQEELIKARVIISGLLESRK